MLELGCGHGLPGLYCLLHAHASAVDFQDLNREVLLQVWCLLCCPAPRRTHLAQVTIPNVLYNAQLQASQSDRAAGAVRPAGVGSGARFLAGDWNDPALLDSLASPGASIDGMVPSATQPVQAAYDLVLSSDTLYSTASMQALVRLLEQVLRVRAEQARLT